MKVSTDTPGGPESRLLQLLLHLRSARRRPGEGNDGPVLHLVYPCCGEVGWQIRRPRKQTGLVRRRIGRKRALMQPAVSSERGERRDRPQRRQAPAPKSALRGATYRLRCEHNLTPAHKRLGVMAAIYLAIQPSYLPAHGSSPTFECTSRAVKQSPSSAWGPLMYISCKKIATGLAISMEISLRLYHTTGPLGSSSAGLWSDVAGAVPRRAGAPLRARSAAGVGCLCTATMRPTGRDQRLCPLQRRAGQQSHLLGKSGHALDADAAGGIGDERADLCTRDRADGPDRRLGVAPLRKRRFNHADTHV